MTPSFLLAPGSGPQDYATRRAMIQAMMPQFGKASTIGEGLGQLFTGIGLGRQQKALDAEEAAARQSAMTGFDSLMSRGGTAQPGGFSINGSIPMQPPSPGQSVADDTMQALGYGGQVDRSAVVSGLVDRGIPAHIAEGFALNFGDESAFKTTALGDNGNAYGLAQWNGPRKAALEAFAAQRGKPVSDMGTQLDFLVSELQGPEASAWGRISAAQTPQEAAVAVLNHFERPAEQHRQRRESQYSTAELAAYAVNPNLPADKRAMAAQMLAETQAAEERARQQQDPAYVLGLQADQLAVQKAQIELAQMQQPKPGFVQLSPQEVTALGLPPGVYQRGPDGRIDTVEKTQGMADPIAELKARATAAGLTEGTAEYQTFMLNGGKPQDGMVIESDGQGGFRMVQGQGAGAAAAKPFTEAQSKDVVYATRAKGALTALDPIANKLADRSDIAAGWLPFGLGGGMQDPDYQVAKTAGDEFLQAILRKDTGAGITQGEQDLYGVTYLPQPGDSAERLTYKAQARQRAVAAIEAGMAPAQIIAQERAIEASNPDIPPPPPGVDPADWQYMTPEERSLFQ